MFEEDSILKTPSPSKIKRNNSMAKQSEGNIEYREVRGKKQENRPFKECIKSHLNTLCSRVIPLVTYTCIN